VAVQSVGSKLKLSHANGETSTIESAISGMVVCMTDQSEKTRRGPVDADSIPWEPWEHGVRFGGRVRALTRAFGHAHHVGVIMEELPPGRQSCPAHYHLQEEEHVFVLEGELCLRLGDQELPLRAGQYICFPAGEERAHCLINRGSTACRYLVIGENKPHETIVYPDSNKLLARSPGQRRVLDLSCARQYWDGEGADLPINVCSDDTRRGAG
jgi:uncharacterized cupin superfamily protein